MVRKIDLRFKITFEVGYMEKEHFDEIKKKLGFKNDIQVFRRLLYDHDTVSMRKYSTD